MCGKLSPQGIYLLRWGVLGREGEGGGFKVGWTGGGGGLWCSQAMPWQVERRQT